MPATKPILFCDDGSEIELPIRWEICTRCEGCGTDRGASVECDGGGFTSEEWAEQDDDFKQDYLAGRYDRPCAYCDGSGKVQRADRKRMTKEQWRDYVAQCREDALDRRIERMERAMGA
jgi:RecJ-like exonuclease